MPYRVALSDKCPTSKPWACLNADTGALMGCHETQAAADRQMAALYANEPEASSDLGLWVMGATAVKAVHDRDPVLYHTLWLQRVRQEDLDASRECFYCHALWHELAERYGDRIRVSDRNQPPTTSEGE